MSGLPVLFWSWLFRRKERCYDKKTKKRATEGDLLDCMRCSINTNEKLCKFQNLH